MDAWLRGKPTGESHVELLIDIAAERPSLVRPLARSFLRARDFACVEEEEREECGSMVGVDVMGELKSSARPGDACLNRALALWAVSKGQLGDEDVQSLVSELAEIAKMPEPERELPGKVAELMRGMGDAVRLAWLSLLPEEIAAANLAGLSGASLRELFSETGLEAALLALDAKKHQRFLLEAMRSNQPALSDTTLGKLLGHFVDRKSSNVARTLRWLAQDGPCKASMTAALALAERGNPSFLPKARQPNKDETEEAATWALCRISHDPDAERQLARYREYLPPDGEVVMEHTGEWVQESPERQTTFTLKDVTEWNLPGETFAPACSSGDCAEAPTVTLHFSRGKNGILYLSGVEIDHPYTTC